MTTRKKKPSVTSQTNKDAAGSDAVEKFAEQGLDEKSGIAALALIQPLLAKLPTELPSSPRLNTQQAASATLAVVQAVDELGLRPRMKRQADIGEFELEYLDRLPDMARASLFLRHEIDRAAVQSSEAQIPEAIATEGFALRSRMLRVLDFNFENDPKVAPDLDAIRRNSGYQDLADDLTALGGLYAKHGKALAAGTPLHYQASDCPDAAKLASRIVAELGKSLAQAGRSAQSQKLAQVMVLMTTAYDEVTALGRHLCRHNADQVARFPSLFTVTRSRPRRQAPADPASPTEPAPSSQHT